MANYTTPSKVQQVIMAGDTVEQTRSRNRTTILNAANCVPPLTEQQAKKMQVKINVNWGELATLLTKAVTQMLSAFTGNQYYFTVSLPRAPKETQADWGAFITEEINRIIMRDIKYYLLQWSKWSSVAKFGIGVQTWRKADSWRPRFCALQDIRIATDTTLDFENLNWYAQRVQYTVLELLDDAFNDNPNNHWHKEGVKQILQSYKETNYTDATQNMNWDTDVERLSSILRQNGGFYGSNALPTIPLYHFYFEDDNGTGGRQWYMRVVPETGGVVKGAGDEDKFLWESKKPVARTWENLMQCQFGDLSFDDPQTFGGVRGLGFLLLEPTFYGNLTRCRLVQHVHDNMNILLRITDPSNKARPVIQEFQNLGVIRDGVHIVGQNERHQIQAALVETVMAQMKQLQGEASSSYTQQADTGTDKEQTAFETRVKAEQVNSMTSGIILKGSKFEDQANREICRRFCNPESNDPDVLEFQARCRNEKIPPAWLDVRLWDVQTVTPIGMGNPTIAQAAIEQLQRLAPKLSPQAQAEINHESVLVLTKDYRKAQRWAPMPGKTTQSDATREAVGMFGTLMLGIPIPPMQNNYIDQIEALIPMLAGQITILTQRNNMATQEQGMGMQNVLTYISQGVQRLGQDPQQKERVKKYTDSLAQLGNEIKALIQRGMEAAKAQAAKGAGGEGAAKLQLEAARARQSMAIKEKEFQLSEARKDREAKAKQRREDAAAFAGIEHDRFGAMAGAHNARLKSFNEGGEE